MGYPHHWIAQPTLRYLLYTLVRLPPGKLFASSSPCCNLVAFVRIWTKLSLPIDPSFLWRGGATEPLPRCRAPFGSYRRANPLPCHCLGHCKGFLTQSVYPSSDTLRCGCEGYVRYSGISYIRLFSGDVRVSHGLLLHYSVWHPVLFFPAAGSGSLSTWGVRFVQTKKNRFGKGQVCSLGRPEPQPFTKRFYYHHAATRQNHHKSINSVCQTFFLTRRPSNASCSLISFIDLLPNNSTPAKK